MLKPKHASQSKIAAAIGVSRATVSLVLRGDAGASKETEKKVREAALRMGYRPNALVRGIRSGKSRSIGVLVPPFDTYWTDILHGIHDRLIGADYMPFILWNNDRLEGDRNEYALQQINRLLDRRVDGVIFWPQFATLYAGHLKEFSSRNLPLVAIDQSIDEHAKCDVVTCDEEEIGKLAIAHLERLGHRKLLLITGPLDIHWAALRVGFLKKAAKRVAGMALEILELPDWRFDAAGDGMGRLTSILRGKSRPTAIIAGTDHLAPAIYDTAQGCQLKIPGDLSVLGITDLEMARLLRPSLTSIRQDGYATGWQAGEICLQRSVGLLSGPARYHKIPVSLMARDSTAPKPII